MDIWYFHRTNINTWLSLRAILYLLLLSHNHPHLYVPPDPNTYCHILYITLHLGTLSYSVAISFADCFEQRRSEKNFIWGALTWCHVSPSTIFNREECQSWSEHDRCMLAYDRSCDKKHGRAAAGATASSQRCEIDNAPSNSPWPSPPLLTSAICV